MQEDPKDTLRPPTAASSQFYGLHKRHIKPMRKPLFARHPTSRALLSNVKKKLDTVPVIWPPHTRQKHRWKSSQFFEICKERRCQWTTKRLINALTIIRDVSGAAGSGAVCGQIPVRERSATTRERVR
uniref:Uncharacterized protein n=1 Tax=Steinernema glaseri TaxID=37863 RepID=A0A1I8AVI9_9BILA